MRPLLVVVLLTVPFAASVHAVTIFDNFGPGYSYQESASRAVLGIDSFMGEQDVAMSFVATGSYALESIAVAMGTASGPDALLDLSLHGDDGGKPGAAALESWVIGGMAEDGTDKSPVWAISTLNPLLAAGTRYWLVAEATTDPSAMLAWNDNETGDVGLSAYRVGGGNWTTEGSSVRGAFQVNGADGQDIPEPSTLALVGLGLAGLLLCGRRRAG